MDKAWTASDWAWRKLRAQVLLRDGHRCWICGGHAGQVDHLLPVARGGTHALTNLRACCQRCNSAKRDRVAQVPATSRAW